MWTLMNGREHGQGWLLRPQKKCTAPCLMKSWKVLLKFPQRWICKLFWKAWQVTQSPMISMLRCPLLLCVMSSWHEEQLETLQLIRWFYSKCFSLLNKAVGEQERKSHTTYKFVFLVRKMTQECRTSASLCVKGRCLILQQRPTSQYLPWNETPKSTEDADRDSTTFHVPHAVELITSHANEQLCDGENEWDFLTPEVALEMVPCPHHGLSLAKLAFIQSPACIDTSYLLKLLKCKVPDSCLLLHIKKLPHFLCLEVIEKHRNQKSLQARKHCFCII